MEENKIETMFKAFSKVVEVAQEVELRSIKNEKLLLNVFTYLFNKCEELEQRLKEIEGRQISTESVDNIYNKTEQSVEDNNNDTIEEQPPEITEEDTQEPIITEQQKTIKTNRKKRRPWYYIFVKKYRYRKLLEEKLALEAEIHERNRLKEIEREKERQRLLEEQKRKDEEERLRREEEQKQRRKDAQMKMAQILRGMKKT